WNGTTCLSAMTPLSDCDRAAFDEDLSRQARYGKESREPGPWWLARGPPSRPIGYRSGVNGEPAARPASHVLRVVGLPLLRRHLVEQHVRALQRRTAPQVVQRPHLLLVAQAQVRRRRHCLAVVAHEAHLGPH